MDVLMPQLGETVAEGTVANWHKKEGDTVAVDEILFDVETDKVSMEVPSLAAGVIAKILVPAGTTVEVGTVVAVIETGAAASAEPPARAAAPAPSPAAPAPSPAAPAPSHAAAPPGARQAASPPPAPTRPPAPAESPPPGWYAAMPPSMSGAAEQYTPPAATSSSPHPGGASLAATRGEMRLSPAVRRLAAEYRVDLTAVSGSGRNGRITRRNVVDFIEAMKSRPAAQTSPARASAPQAATAPAHSAAPAHAAAPAARAAPSQAARAPAATSGGVLPFTRIRKLTAEHMVRSKATRSTSSASTKFERPCATRSRRSTATRSRICRSSRARFAKRCKNSRT